MRELLRSVVFCLLACAAVVVFAVIVVGKAKDLRNANLSVRTWRDIEVTTERVLGALRDSETGQRGYLLTLEPDYLAPFNKASQEVSVLTNELENFSRPMPAELDIARKIDVLAKLKLAELTNTIDSTRSGNAQAAMAEMKTHRGKILMDEIRGLAAEIGTAATDGARASRAQADLATRHLVSSVLTTSTLSILLLVLLTYFLRRDARILRASAERLAITVASVGEAVIATDSEGRVERMNPVAEELTGWRVTQAAGQPLNAVFRIVNEHTRLPVESPHDKVLREGNVVGLANHTVLISKDHTERPIEDSGAPIRGIDGEIAGVVLVFKDASARYAAERAQRDSENRFKAAVAAMEGVLWTNSPQGEMRGEQAGWAALTGQSYEAYQGYGWSRAVHPEDAQPTIDAWNRAVANRITFKFEHRVRRHDGQWRLFSIRAIPILDNSGDIREWVGVHTDVTEQREAFASLKEADRRKDEFLATLAHELRNPVAPIRHAISILDKEQVPEEQQRWSRAVITRQVNHMARLLDDLLDSARITRGELSLQPAPVELNSLITEALDTARPIIDRKHHALDLILPEPPISLNVDGTRIAQVLSNLLTNAAKYTDSGGAITLEAAITSEQFLISVKDSGVGLSPESLPHVFKMFHQVQSVRDRSEGGLGIGLCLANELVKLHGGQITATSAGEGQGSVFSVALPISAVTTMGSAPASETAQTPRINASRLVLVIDDNVDAAASLAMLLELSGNEVLLAHTGEDGLLIARKHRPTAVVIDIGLPGINGYQVAQALRQEHWAHEICLIALTGWGQASDKQSAASAGFDHHLTKPADADDVHRLIAASVDTDLSVPVKAT